MRYFPRSLVAALAACCSTFAQAQTPNEHAISYSALDSEIKQPHQEAKGSQYIHVLVDLAIDNSLAAFKKNPSPDFNRVQDAVLQSIEGDYVKGAVWRSRLGQLSVYVTGQGFTKLLKNPAVRNVLRAVERPATYDAPAGEFQKIAEEIRQKGSAVVSVIPSGRSPQPKDGQKALAEPLGIEARKWEFIQSLHMENFQSYRVDGTRSITEQPGAASRSIDFITKLEGLYELKSRDDVRSIRLVNSDRARLASEIEEQEIFLDPLALVEAEKMGYAIVGIDLKRWPGYTPIASLLTPAEQQEQKDRIKQMLTEIVEAVEPGASANLQSLNLIASSYVKLQLNSLRKLYQAPDPRIQRVNANIGIPIALNVSTAGGTGAPMPSKSGNPPEGAGNGSQ